MALINPFFLLFIYLLMFCIIDNVMAYFALDFSLIILWLYQNSILDIPTGTESYMSLLWALVMLLSFTMHIHLANKAYKKYGSLLGER